MEEVEEEEDRVAASSEEEGGIRRGGSGGGLVLDDSIEVESDVETAQDDEEKDMSGGGFKLGDPIEMESDAEAAEDDEEDMSGGGVSRGGGDSIEYDSLGPLVSIHESSPLEEREPKRRRVSISPMPLSPPEDDDVDSAIGYVSGDDDAHETASSSQRSSSAESLGDPGTLHDQARAAGAAPPQQPTFRAAPRFKPVETDAAAFDGLPVAFSPQRRGAKYIPGGLAAGLQGWLSDIKGWEGVDRGAEVVARVVVEEVRPGRRMYLVRGREVGTSSSLGRVGGKRFLLAGEGKLTGLGRRAVVGVGSVVNVGQPVWDVELEGDVWTVSCDWSVS